MAENNPNPSPLLAAIASAIVPGAGYLLIGEKLRALVTGGGILLLFLLGILIAGARVISVPGYDEEGYLRYVEFRRSGENSARLAYTNTPAVAVRTQSPEPQRGPWTVTRVRHDGTLEEQPDVNDPPLAPSKPLLLSNPLGLLGENLSFIGQAFNGPLCAAGGYLSIQAARAKVDPPIAKSYSRLADIGNLYTAVSGMLNLMVIVDTYTRARAQARRKEQEA